MGEPFSNTFVMENNSFFPSFPIYCVLFTFLMCPTSIAQYLPLDSSLFLLEEIFCLLLLKILPSINFYVPLTFHATFASTKYFFSFLPHISSPWTWPWNNQIKVMKILSLYFLLFTVLYVVTLNVWNKYACIWSTEALPEWAS